MPRRDDYEDDHDDREPHRPATKDNTLLIVALVVGLAVLAGGGLIAALAFTTVTTEQVQPEAQPVTAANPMPRDEFRNLVLGKTQDEVIKLIGKPNRTSDTGGDATWHYKDATFDPVNNKPDTSVWLWFRNGKVDQVNF